MRFILLLSAALLSLSAFAEAGISCRKGVVLAGLALGEKIAEDSFSVKQPEDFSMAAQEFNALSPQEQEEIYLQYMPMETMVKNMQGRIERNIMYIKRDPFAAFYMQEELKLYEDVLSFLLACEYE